MVLWWWRWRRKNGGWSCDGLVDEVAEGWVVNFDLESRCRGFVKGSRLLWLTEAHLGYIAQQSQFHSFTSSSPVPTCQTYGTSSCMPASSIFYFGAGDQPALVPGILVQPQLIVVYSISIAMEVHSKNSKQRW